MGGRFRTALVLTSAPALLGVAVWFSTFWLAHLVQPDQGSAQPWARWEAGMTAGYVGLSFGLCIFAVTVFELVRINVDAAARVRLCVHAVLAPLIVGGSVLAIWVVSGRDLAVVLTATVISITAVLIDMVCALR